jgi:hypothetical protein
MVRRIRGGGNEVDSHHRRPRTQQQKKEKRQSRKKRRESTTAQAKKKKVYREGPLKEEMGHGQVAYQLDASTLPLDGFAPYAAHMSMLSIEIMEHWETR